LAVPDNSGMAEEPDHIVLHDLRRLDDKVDALREDNREIKQRLGILEQRYVLLEQQYASLSSRMDRIEMRLGLLETRLDLVEV
jgi:predicted nuclease with TOPRIM domain